MAHALTENQANANFTTGVTVPDNGDSGTTWWGVIIALIQQFADRFQRLRLWVPDAPVIHIPLVPLDFGANFFSVVSSDKVLIEQSTASSSIGAYFPIPQLVTGRKITGITAYWQNASNTTQPVQTPAAVALKKVVHSVGTVTPDDTEIGIQADTTVVVADYQKIHTISLTGMTETIAADAQYYIEFAGESGTNSTTGGRLWGFRVTLGV